MVDKEKARRKKQKQRIDIIEKTKTHQMKHTRKGVKTLLRMDLVPGRVCGGKALGIRPTERLSWRRMLAEAAGESPSSILVCVC